jgi:soluble lytic murein transglycosylase-like protein
MFCALLPNWVSAELAVFVDGRVLKVEDARLEGEVIVLDLPGGGIARVPAVRIDRVIADEIEVNEPSDAIDEPSCPASWTDEPLAEGVPYREEIIAAARAADLDPWLVTAVVRAESDFDPLARSRAGAAGLMQLMPAAASENEVGDVFDPAENLRGGSAHLRAMLDRFGSLPLALAAYNAGAATVDRYQGIPPFRETRRYVRTVLEVFCPEG